ncbi:MAG: argininosuccinate lyase [Balneolaceae bacterium]
MSKLWETGDPSGPAGKDKTGGKVEKFTVGNDYRLDRVLLPYDLKASGVHLLALQGAGVLSAGEAEELENGLDRIRQLWEDGDFEIKPEHEDGHTAIELWLTGELGDLGKKIHTGRSRNDQVLTAMRLYEKDHLEKTLFSAVTCVHAILDLAEANRELPMPGYTHTRKAMLSTVGQWLGGFAELLIMQIEASDGVKSLTGRCPLGTAAGFGSTIGLDRDLEAEELGFEQPVVCSTSAQLSRGWVELQLVEFLSGFTSVLARLAGDIIVYSSQAYGYIDIDPELCTGSSIMPNKKNPDVAELIRGKSSLMAGYAATLRGITANLGSGYHRDLQLTKEPVMQAFDTADELLEMTRLLVRGLSLDEGKLRNACSSDLLAAEEAYKLVKEQGVSFRDAYRQVKSRPDSDFTMDIDELFGLYTQLGSPGNPGLERLRKQVERWRI